MDNHIFRSALSGFNRQDVMEYIERTQKQAEEAAARLEDQVRQARQECDEARQALDACTEEKEALSRQLEEMTLKFNHAKNNWEAQAQAKESFRQDVTQRDQTVRELTEENQGLFRRVQDLEDQLASMRLEKERITQLELDAHQRADEVVAQASAQAQLIQTQAQAQADGTIHSANEEAQAAVAQARSQAQALLRAAAEKVGETAAAYDQLFQSFPSITSHISGELRKLDVTAAQLPISFNHLKDGLHQLQEQARERAAEE